MVGVAEGREEQERERERAERRERSIALNEHAALLAVAYRRELSYRSRQAKQALMILNLHTQGQALAGQAQRALVSCKILWYK